MSYTMSGDSIVQIFDSELEYAFWRTGFGSGPDLQCACEYPFSHETDTIASWLTSGRFCLESVINHLSNQLAMFLLHSAFNSASNNIKFV